MNDRGRVDINLAQTTIDDVLESIEQMSDKLPFLLRLSVDEKQRLTKPRAGANEVAEAILALQEEAGMPVAPDDAMVADLTVYRGLTAIADALTELLERIEDTKLQAGAEAWSESLVRYGVLRQMARSKPQLTIKLDRIRPLVNTRRRTRKATAAAAAPQPTPVPVEAADSES